jgi:MFS family permease
MPDKGRSPVSHDEPGRPSFIKDLRTVLGGRGFRQLFTTRLISQAGDGVFTAGLGTYVFFNATSFPNPAAAATSFAVLYLPYSLIGPFAGVFIDRWSRRQILLWSALLRSCFAALTALFIAAGALGLPVWLAALVVLGVNRFFLSALSAALPHVVSRDDFVMANSVGPTSGTVIAFAGGLAGVGVRLATGPGAVASAVTLLAAGAFYLVAGLSATRMTRAQLGPDPGEGARPAAAADVAESITAGLGSVAVGLASGLREVWRRRQARAALLATGSHRLLYGILLLMSILLYRNYFYPAGGGNTALRHFLPVVALSAAGYGTAALITPVATRQMSSVTWIAALMAAGGLVTGGLGLTFGQAEFVAIGFSLGVVAQGLTICTTTILQREMPDDFRGRVFSVNDVVYNVMFVLGAAVSAAFMPVTGHSAAMLAFVACGYLAAAAGYRLLAGQVPPVDALPEEVPPDPPGRPDSRAQRSNSDAASS